MSTKRRSGTRLEAFSDGVLAIILTIMVLELKTPHESGMHGLISVLPHLGLYLLSFVFVGIFWINHHELCRRVESIDYRILWANLAWLFSISLIPYFTDYVGEMHFDSFSTALYAGVMMFAGFFFYILRLTIVRRQKRLHEYTQSDRSELVKHGISLALYLSAIGMAFRSVWIAFLLICAVTFVWIAPEFGTGTCNDEPAE